MIERSICLWLIFFKDQRDQFDHGPSSKIDGSDSMFWHKGGGRVSKTFAKYIFLRANYSFFLERLDLFNLFQRLTRAIQSFHSFSKIDESDSITIDLFKRSTRAIQSWSIFLKDQKDRRIENRKIKFPTLICCM